MTEQRYDIFFTGKLVEGTDQNTAINNAAKLFKLSIEEAGKLFSNKPQLLKRRVDKAEAIKYKAALHQAGLLTAFKLSTTTDSPAITNKPPADNKSERVLSLAPTGSDVLAKNERQAFIPVDIDTSDIKLQSPFIDPEVIQSPQPPPPPNTSHLKIVELSPHLKVASPAPKTTIDTHNLSLAPAGGIIETLKTQTKALNPDTSSISLAPLDSQAFTSTPKPNTTVPDTSHLSLAKEE